ncbi:S-layer homology domain-containing protein [Demequina sp. NBRC 110053]|uniref:S-layer homology domain-containing protein n=1 Tax=Demequina sp. NBRC 110053 TaxID=1570342 RepID=UPI0013563BA6|nr:S-layer homology domain-containing protein [Demequina sp. NBRC 110053]
MTSFTSTRAQRVWAASITGALMTGVAAATPAVTQAVPEIEPAAATVEDGSSRFTVAVLPDTQFYSRYSAAQFEPKYGTDPFEVQTRWIVEHDEELNTAFTLHLGDVVDQEWVAGEWAAANRAISALEEGDAPFSILPGNHDVANPGQRGSEQNASNYLTHFPSSRAEAGATWVASHQNGYSTAHVFEAEGQEFLVLALGWNAPASTWAWAQEVLDAHPTLPTILTSHAIVDVDKSTGEATDTEFGQELWDQLIRSNDQIFVTLNGHFHGQTRRTVINDAGHEVYQLLLDSQMAADGGNGIMGMMEFDLDEGVIDFATISPWVTVKDEGAITPSDTPVLTGEQSDFTLAVNFEDRFADFAPDFGPGDGSFGELNERAKEIVSDGWEGGDGAGSLQAPGDRTDYVEVDGTLAHWRFGAVDTGILPEGGVIPDETGDNPMHRLPLDQTNAPDELDQVTISRDNVSAFSSDQGAVCFADASRNTGVTNYITTDYEVPVTKAAFEDGYTIESFVYLADEWNVEDNQWGGWLTRTGRRSTLPISWERYDYEMGPAFFSVSNLREFQWATSQGTPWRGTTSLWSGEIMTGNWYHVAAVNDPQAHTTIMYVDGVPVLRNAVNHDGMTFNDGYPWALGTVFNHDEASNGWNGCVGETRIVDHALDPSEFLIQRPDIDAGGANLSLTDAPAGELAPGSKVSSLHGTGYAGAQVRVSNGDVVVATTTVDEGGTWSADFDEAIAAPGSHRLSVVQSIGTRDGAPAAVEFSIQASPSSEFVDVSGDESSPLFNEHHAAIAWMAERGISTGWEDGTFRPYSHATRDAIAAFLYRAAGEPSVEDEDAALAAFADVSADPRDGSFNEHHTAIAWMAEAGITTGWEDGTFRPFQPVTRDAIAAFLHRAAGEPSIEDEDAALAAFTDVPATVEHRSAVAWMVEAGITTGWEDGTFRPFQPVTRDAIAAFLRRASTDGA